MVEWRKSTWGAEISLEYGKGIRGYADAAGPFRVFGSNGPVGWTAEALAPSPGVILGRKGAYRGVQFSKQPFFVIDTAYYVVPKSALDMRWLYYAIIHYKLGEIDDGSPILMNPLIFTRTQFGRICPAIGEDYESHCFDGLHDFADSARRICSKLCR